MTSHGKTFVLKQAKYDTSGSREGKDKFVYMDYNFRLYYELVARVIFVGILPITALIFLNGKIFLALKKFRRFRAEKIQSESDFGLKMLYLRRNIITERKKDPKSLAGKNSGLEG